MKKTYLPISTRAYRRQVYIILRDLPHRFIQLYSVVSTSHLICNKKNILIKFFKNTLIENLIWLNTMYDEYVKSELSNETKHFLTIWNIHAWLTQAITISLIILPNYLVRNSSIAFLSAQQLGHLSTSRKRLWQQAGVYM